MSPSTATALVDELLALPDLPALALSLRERAFDAARARDRSFLAGRLASVPPPGQGPGAASSVLSEPPSGVRDLLLRAQTAIAEGPENEQDATLLGALLALSLRYLEHPLTLEGAACLVWLATHTPLNALEALDVALESTADAIWPLVAEVVRSPGAAATGFGRAEALVGAAALRASHSETARDLALRLAQEVHDRALRLFLLGPRRREYPAALSGELVPAPRHPVLTFFFTITLILPLIQGLRLIGRYAFAYRQPARIRLSPRGLELEYRTELLGRVLKDRATLIPLGELRRVTREVRYSRAGLYAGLGALVTGTYFGMGLFVDGVRIPGGSKPLLGLAFLMMFAGLAIDFGLSYLSDALRGRCRLLVVARSGKRFCVGELEPNRADAMLARIADHTLPEDPHPVRASAAASRVGASG